MTVAFRFIALVLIVVALMLLGADIVTSLQDKNLTVRSLGEVWGIVAPSGLESFKSWIEAHLPQPGPNWVFAFLATWAWGVFGVLGVLIAFLLGRQPHEA